MPEQKPWEQYQGVSQSSFDTPLSTAEEAQFQQWKSQYAPKDSGADYDLRGAFKTGLTPDPQTGHWPDTFKKPNHPTFSVESKYATGENAAKAGKWIGPNHDQFTPPVSQSAGPWTEYGGTSPSLSDQLKEILAKQKGQAPDSRTGTEVMQDQAANVLKGIPQAITGIPGALLGAGKVLNEWMNPGARMHEGALPETMGMLKGMAAPITTPLRGLGALMAPNTINAPTDQEWGQAAQGAGSMLGSAALPNVVEGITKPLVAPLRAGAVRNMEQAFSPAGKSNQLIMRRIAPELVDRGVIAGSQERLAGKMASNRAEAGQALEQGWAAEPNKLIDTKPLTDALEKSKWDHNAMALDAQGNPVVQGPELVKAADKVKAIVDQYGTILGAPSESLVKLRRLWDSAVEKSNGFETPDIGAENMFKREGSSAIREILSQEHPNMNHLNAEYGLWKGATDVIADTVRRQIGKGTPVGQQVAQAAGAAAGLAAKGPMAAIENAAALGMLNRLTQSVAWKTVSAAAKNDLAKAIMSGNQTLTSLTVAKIAAEAGNKGQQ